jgi:hypothetical protein
MSEHAIIHREQTGPQAEQGVCECGALITVLWQINGQTLASQFAAHVRRANEESRVQPAPAIDLPDPGRQEDDTKAIPPWRNRKKRRGEDTRP